jgi:ribosomal-protein-alanine N-acetyltransferase
MGGIKLEKNVNGHDNFYDLGYRFLPEYWGKGYATEASRAVVVYAFTTLKLPKICAYIEHDNLASKKVAEKVGLRLSSTFMGHQKQELWMELDNTEWKRT